MDAEQKPVQTEQTTKPTEEVKPKPEANGDSTITKPDPLASLQTQVQNLTEIVTKFMSENKPKPESKETLKPRILE